MVSNQSEAGTTELMRRFGIAVGWLVVGCIANVLFAWLASVSYQWDRPWRPGTAVFGWAIPSWPYPAQIDGEPPDVFQRTWTLWVDFDEAHNRREVPELLGAVFYRRAKGYRFGFPFRCMASWVNARRATSITSMQVQIPGVGPRRIPLHPIWLGLALNTIFYAAIAWGLWQIPLALRRRSRRRSGKCVRCAYSLSGLTSGAPCPECGRPPR